MKALTTFSYLMLFKRLYGIKMNDYKILLEIILRKHLLAIPPPSTRITLGMPYKYSKCPYVTPTNLPTQPRILSWYSLTTAGEAMVNVFERHFNMDSINIDEINVILNIK